MELNGQSVLTLFTTFIGFYAVFTLIVAAPSILQRLRRFRDRSRIETRAFPRATIAYDLVPKLRPFLSKRPTLYVTASDGYPLTTARRYPWPGFISEALGFGCDVHYLLADVSEQDEAQLFAARDRIGAGRPGKLHLYFLNIESVSDEDRDLIESLCTFHVVLVETTNERMMWTEDYHPKRSTVAYGCKFTAPAEAKDNNQYDEYKAAITHLTERYKARRPLDKAA